MADYPQISVDTEMGEGMCFGCGPNNPIGLKLDFQPYGEKVRAEFSPAEHYQGWTGILHGGIIMCLLDEAMAYAAKIKARVNCLTARMSVNLSRPVRLTESLVITGIVTRVTRKLVESSAEIALTDGTVVASGTSKQFVIGPNGEYAG